jgi:hypothetical protein
MMAKETIVTIKVPVAIKAVMTEPVKVVMTKSEVMAMIKSSKSMAKSAATRKMRRRAHVSSHTLPSRGLHRDR